MDPNYREGLNEADACEWGFVRTLLHDPSDKVARGAFADWLDEHDRGVQARYLRQIRLHKFIRAVKKRGSVAILGSQYGRPTIPQVVARFAEYRSWNLAWGALHIVLDDNNVSDDSVLFCLRYTQPGGPDENEEAYWLSCILLDMSPTQRLKIGHIADYFLQGTSFRYQTEEVLERVQKYPEHVAKLYKRDRATRELRRQRDLGPLNRG